MKLPKWNGVTKPSVFIFSLVCFVVGYAVVTIFSLGQIRYDDRDGPGWNPVSQMPDGKTGLSETAIEGIGFVVLAFGSVVLFGLGVHSKHTR